MDRVDWSKSRQPPIISARYFTTLNALVTPDTLVDWKGILPIAEEMAEKHGVLDRFTFLPGDIQDVDLGKGYQVATLGHVLHSEGEIRSKTLLRRVFEALEAGGTIVIAEFLVNANRTGPLLSLIFAVSMLLNTDDGDAFSFEDIAGWLQEVGFIEPRLVRALGPSPLILATRPDRLDRS